MFPLSNLSSADSPRCASWLWTPSCLCSWARSLSCMRIVLPPIAIVLNKLFLTILTNVRIIFSLTLIGSKHSVWPMIMWHIWGKSVWIQGALPLSSCVTLGRLFNLSELQFPHLENGGGSYTCLQELFWGRSETMHGMHLAPRPAGTLWARKSWGEKGQILQDFIHHIKELGIEASISDYAIWALEAVPWRFSP